MRRNVFLFAFGALVAVACANSTVPDSTGTIVKSDASADTGSSYDAGYGTTEDSGSTEDTGATVTDAGKKETSTIADSAVQDTGSTTAGQCDTANNPAYDFQFAAILISGDPLPPECSTGCAATECCYDAGGAGMYCLTQ
jgi:hypothetical protein